MHTVVEVCLTLSALSIAGRMFTSFAAKTLESKAMSAATNAAMIGVKKVVAKVVDHVVDKVPRPRKPSVQRSKPNQQLIVKRSRPHNQTQ